MEHKQSKLVSNAHLTKLNINKFKIIEAMGLRKLLYRGHLEYHYVLNKFHENLPSGSNVISVGQTDSHLGIIEVTFNAITTIQNFIQIHQSVKNVHPPQMFNRRPL
jgi:hypothetical protein